MTKELWMELFEALAKANVSQELYEAAEQLCINDGYVFDTDNEGNVIVVVGEEGRPPIRTEEAC